MSDLTNPIDNIIQLHAPQDGVRKLQVKAAVTKAEKERFERLAAAQGTKLSILIRELLEQLSTASGV